MLKRLSVNYYRCLENFVFEPDVGTNLLVGRNGAGKSTIGLGALLLLQKIGRGESRCKNLIDREDMTWWAPDGAPVRIEVEVEINDSMFVYGLALEFPESFREARIYEERLHIDGVMVFERKTAQVTVEGLRVGESAEFVLDWHTVALPIVNSRLAKEGVDLFRTWLSERMVLLQPVAQTMRGITDRQTMQIESSASNLVDWLDTLLATYPAAYSDVFENMQSQLPDLQDIQRPSIGGDKRELIFNFSKTQTNAQISGHVRSAMKGGAKFKQLSDGERLFLLASVLIAAQKCYGPLFVFWDEPDTHIGLSEVRSLVLAFRRAFEMSDIEGGQFILSSHNEEVMRAVSAEGTWLLSRYSHLEPPSIRRVSDLPDEIDIVAKLRLGQANP